MTAITIRDIPDDQLRTLKIRAAQAGQSLQAFLQGVITREASRPTWREVTDRLDRDVSAEFATEDVLKAIDEERHGR